MVSLLDLWAPIVASAVLIFILSFVSWVVLPFHNSVWKKAPSEDDLLRYVRGGVPGGQYMFPHCTDWKDAEAVERYKAGPHGHLTVYANPPSMPRNLVLTFIFYVVVSVFCGYVATISLPAGAEYLKVFQVTGTAALMGYCFAVIPNAIWFGGSLRGLVLDLVDGVVYALCTAGFFGWLWPTSVVA